jgi:hypothetical protein
MQQPSTPKPTGTAICAVFRDEAPYLAEWVEFHRLVGVEHFFLYDDRSRDASRDVLAPQGTGGRRNRRVWASAKAVGVPSAAASRCSRNPKQTGCAPDTWAICGGRHDGASIGRRGG